MADGGARRGSVVAAGLWTGSQRGGRLRLAGVRVARRWGAMAGPRRQQGETGRRGSVRACDRFFCIGLGRAQIRLVVLEKIIAL